MLTLLSTLLDVGFSILSILFFSASSTSLSDGGSKFMPELVVTLSLLSSDRLSISLAPISRPAPRNMIMPIPIICFFFIFISPYCQLFDDELRQLANYCKGNAYHTLILAQSQIKGRSASLLQ